MIQPKKIVNVILLIPDFLRYTKPAYYAANYLNRQGSMNKRTLLFVIIPIILFILLAVSVSVGIITGFEGWAYNETVEYMSPQVTSIVKGITHIGDSATVIAFCLLLIALPKTRKTIALPVSLTVILSYLLNILLKNIFARERPDILRLINETSYSFPSGHAMINASLYTMLIMLVFKYIKNTANKFFLSVLCIAFAVIIGVSRIYLGVHYAGDILAGWVIGFAVSAFVYFVWTAGLENKKEAP